MEQKAELIFQLCASAYDTSFPSEDSSDKHLCLWPRPHKPQAQLGILSIIKHPRPEASWEIQDKDAGEKQLMKKPSRYNSFSTIIHPPII